MEEAHKSFIYRNYKKAIEQYSKLIESQPENSDLLLFRAITYIRDAQYDLALGDLENFGKSKPKNYQGSYRKGIVLFHKGQFAEALTSLKAAEALANNDNEKAQLSTWIQKCLREKGESSAVALNESAMMPISNKEAMDELKTSIPTYDWYQSANFVNMVLKVKGCKKEAISVNFGPQEFEVNIKLDDSNTKEYSYKLSMGIVPEESSYNVDERKIEFKLKKQEEGTQWTSLEKVEKKQEFRPAYPTSSKKKVDWNKLDKEAEKEEAKDKPEGDAALNNLFRAIYE